MPFSGVPYNVFAYLGANIHVLIIVFIAAIVTVRVARYGVIYFLANKLYPVFHKFVYHHFVWLFLIAVFIFSVAMFQVNQAYDNATTSTDGQALVNIEKASVALSKNAKIQA